MTTTRPGSGDFRITMTGDAAITVDFPPRIDPDLNAQVVTLANYLRDRRQVGVLDVVPSYAALTVYIDPRRADVNRLWTILERGAERSAADDESPPREHIVPVQYGGAVGPDLGAVAAFAQCSPEEVVRRHSSRTYRVYLIGFLPGFPYLGLVDDRIAMPRRETPRVAVPGGSIGIAGVQTGIYPTTAPGGWHLVGRTTLSVFELTREPPCLFRPGDTVRFDAVGAGTRS